MRYLRLFALLLVPAVMTALTSCSWWFTTPIEHDSLPDTVDTPDDTSDDFADVTGIPDIESIDKLPESFKRLETPFDSCVIAYNQKNAFMFDYTLGKVTPLVDFEAMLEAADPIERAREYFTDVTLDVECRMSADIEIMITFNVTSTTHDAKYSVYSFYTVDGNYNPRGMLRGYYTTGDIVYPGSDEPIVITDVEDWGKFGFEVYDRNWLYMLSKAFLERDTELLEELTVSQEGTLAPWQNVEISDYKIMRENPTSMYFDSVTLIVNITESEIERYPVGEYKVVIADGPGYYFRIFSTEPSVPDMHNPSAHEMFIRDWVSRFGGWYPIESQTLENPTYAHHLIDFYLSAVYAENDEVRLEDFAIFCEEYFGYKDAEKYISRYEVENHGGHGGASALCEVELEASSGNTYVYSVTFFADQLKTTVAREYRIFVTVRDGDDFCITKIECTFDSGFDVHNWSM